MKDRPRHTPQSVFLNSSIGSELLSSKRPTDVLDLCRQESGQVLAERESIQWIQSVLQSHPVADCIFTSCRVHPKSNVNGDVPQYRNDAEDCVVVHSIVKSVRPNGGEYTVTVDLNGSMTNYKVNQLEQTECIPFPANLGYGHHLVDWPR